MLLQTRTDQDRPLLLFKFILGIDSRHMHILGDIPVITDHTVMQAIVRIFRPDRKITLRLSARIRETILQTGDRSEIGTTTISCRVPTRSKITLTTDMLQG